MFTNNPNQKKRRLYAQRRSQAVLSKLSGIVALSVAVAVAINEKIQTIFANRST
jgi:hypothetical protein